MSYPAPPRWNPASFFDGETVAVLCGGSSLTQAQVDHVRGRCRVVAVNRAYLRAPWADVLWGADPGWFWAWCSGPGRLYPAEPDALEFSGIKCALWSPSPSWPVNHLRELVRLVEAGVLVFHHRGDDWHTGVELELGFVRGNNGAAHLLSSVLPQMGARKVILLGLDMVQRSGNQHWHRPWPNPEPLYESWAPDRLHQATVWSGGDCLELGWFDTEEKAAKVEQQYAEHIVAGCLQPWHVPNLMIPRFATMVAPLEALGIDVVNCSPGSAVRVFRQARLEDELP